MSNSKAPVLIIAYNRPDFLRKQINLCIKNSREFLLAVDGPKAYADAGADECASIARESMKNQELLLGAKINSKNLGCKVGVSDAISWAFEHHDSLIILEDDVSLSDDFFFFMDFSLEKFKDKSEIFLINGWNPLTTDTKFDNYYYMSRCFSPWGWATWRNRWRYYDRDLHLFSSKIEVRNLPTLQTYCLNSQFSKMYKMKLKQCKDSYDTWDYQLLFAMWLQGGFSIMPVRRVSGNRGFDSRATHTKHSLNFVDPSIYELPMASVSKNLNWSELVDFKVRSNLDKQIDYLQYNFWPDKSMKSLLLNSRERVVRKLHSKISKKSNFD